MHSGIRGAAFSLETVMAATSTGYSSTEETPGRFAQIIGDMPASYFSIVLSLADLGNVWRGASRVWQPPESITKWIYVATGIVWAILVGLQIFKAIFPPAKLIEEAARSAQCCLIGLAGVATILIAGDIALHLRLSANIVDLFDRVAPWRLAHALAAALLSEEARRI